MGQLAQAHRADHARTSLDGMQAAPQRIACGRFAGCSQPGAQLRAGIRHQGIGFFEENRQQLQVDFIGNLAPLEHRHRRGRLEVWHQRTDVEQMGNRVGVAGFGRCGDASRLDRRCFNGLLHRHSASRRCGLLVFQFAQRRDQIVRHRGQLPAFNGCDHAMQTRDRILHQRQVRGWQRNLNKAVPVLFERMRQLGQGRDARCARDAAKGMNGTARVFADRVVGKLGVAFRLVLQRGQVLMRFGHENLVQAGGEADRPDADLVRHERRKPGGIGRCRFRAHAGRLLAHRCVFNDGAHIRNGHAGRSLCRFRLDGARLIRHRIDDCRHLDGGLSASNGQRQPFGFGFGCDLGLQLRCGRGTGFSLCCSFHCRCDVAPGVIR